jgi:chromosome segregation ATPase
MRSSIEYLRHLAENHQQSYHSSGNSSSEAPKAPLQTPEVTPDSDFHVDSRRSSFSSGSSTNVSNGSYNDVAEEAAANQSRVIIQARKECRLHLCRLSNEISELRRREKERLNFSLKLVAEKVNLERELLELEKQQKAAELRLEELQRLQYDSNKHIQDLSKEIDALTTKSKELELQKTELKLSGFRKRGEIEEMHEYESGITILMYNLKEYISGQKLQHNCLEEQLQSLTTQCDDLRETINNKEHIDLETQDVIDSCTTLQTDIDCLKKTSEELETVNDTLRSKLISLIEEQASSKPPLCKSLVNKLFKGKVPSATNIIANENS